MFTYGGAAEGDLPNSWLTAFLQEKTTVTIDFQLTPTERFKEQMNLMIASGEFVDVIIAQGNSLTQEALAKFGEAGGFLEERTDGG